MCVAKSPTPADHEYCRTIHIASRGLGKRQFGNMIFRILKPKCLEILCRHPRNRSVPIFWMGSKRRPARAEIGQRQQLCRRISRSDSRPPQCMMILRIQSPALSFRCFDSKGNTHSKSPLSCKEICVLLYMSLVSCIKNGVSLYTTVEMCIAKAVLLCTSDAICIKNGISLYISLIICKFFVINQQIYKFFVYVIIYTANLRLA